MPFFRSSSSGLERHLLQTDPFSLLRLSSPPHECLPESALGCPAAPQFASRSRAVLVALLPPYFCVWWDCCSGQSVRQFCLVQDLASMIDACHRPETGSQLGYRQVFLLFSAVVQRKKKKAGCWFSKLLERMEVSYFCSELWYVKKRFHWFNFWIIWKG